MKTKKERTLILTPLIMGGIAWVIFGYDMYVRAINHNHSFSDSVGDGVAWGVLPAAFFAIIGAVVGMILYAVISIYEKVKSNV